MGLVWDYAGLSNTYTYIYIYIYVYPRESKYPNTVVLAPSTVHTRLLGLILSH